MKMPNAKSRKNPSSQLISVCVLLVKAEALCKQQSFYFRVVPWQSRHEGQVLFEEGKMITLLHTCTAAIQRARWREED